MKKVSLFLFLLISLNINTFSQARENERENFNGTWVLDKAKSTNIGKTFDNYFLVVEFKENKFKLTKVFVAGKQAATYEITLLTDKSGEKNRYTGLDGMMERTSKTRWEKNTLISDFKVVPDNKKFTYGGTETYRLSKDGNRLILESVQNSPAVPIMIEDFLKTRYVFQRKQPKS